MDNILKIVKPFAEINDKMVLALLNSQAFQDYANYFWTTSSNFNVTNTLENNYDSYFAIKEEYQNLWSNITNLSNKKILLLKKISDWKKETDLEKGKGTTSALLKAKIANAKVESKQIKNTLMFCYDKDNNFITKISEYENKMFANKNDKKKFKQLQLHWNNVMIKVHLWHSNLKTTEKNEINGAKIILWTKKISFYIEKEMEAILAKNAISNNKSKLTIETQRNYLKLLNDSIFNLFSTYKRFERPKYETSLTKIAVARSKITKTSKEYLQKGGNKKLQDKKDINLVMLETLKKQIAMPPDIDSEWKFLFAIIVAILISKLTDNDEINDGLFKNQDRKIITDSENKPFVNHVGNLIPIDNNKTVKKHETFKDVVDKLIGTNDTTRYNFYYKYRSKYPQAKQLLIEFIKDFLIECKTEQHKIFSDQFYQDLYLQLKSMIISEKTKQYNKKINENKIRKINAIAENDDLNEKYYSLNVQIFAKKTGIAMDILSKIEIISKLLNLKIYINDYEIKFSDKNEDKSEIYLIFFDDNWYLSVYNFFNLPHNFYRNEKQLSTMLKLLNEDNYGIFFNNLSYIDHNSDNFKEKEKYKKLFDNTILTLKYCD